SFVDFPEDVQLCVLSFLRPSELTAFAVTCRRFASLFREDQRLWYSMCHRRWGSKTLINKWGNGSVSYRNLYRILDEYENLIGFWRRSGDLQSSPSPTLVFFEWSPSSISGSRICPSKNQGYKVIKKPFLWMSISPDGEPMNYIVPESRFTSVEDSSSSSSSSPGESEAVENSLARVNLSFIGENHFVVDENLVSEADSLRPEEREQIYGSPPDKLMSEIYQYFANRTSPSSGNGASRRQRKREKLKQWRIRRFQPEHFVKIVNCSPTPTRPLQGLWKGICDTEMSLDFYLVSYDDVGGIACRKVGDSSTPFVHHAPIFWTSSSTITRPPFPPEEHQLYASRLHLSPPAEESEEEEEEDHRILFSGLLSINSSYELVIPDLLETGMNPRRFEGRIWVYEDCSFGFGFLRENHIVDLKHVARNG
ncbi:hypothetical protein M569_06992, partial [Genlisea aurea]